MVAFECGMVASASNLARLYLLSNHLEVFLLWSTVE
jgi:hypothetical protein